MTATRTIEIFSAGCPACEAAVAQIREIACPSCEVTVLDMKAPGVAERAAALGFGSVPAVVIDGKLADCCTGRRPDMYVLRAIGLGRRLT